MFGSQFLLSSINKLTETLTIELKFAVTEA